MNIRPRLRRFLALLPPTYRAASAHDPVMRELQALHNRTLWRDKPRLIRTATLAAARIAWPFRAALLARRVARALGPHGLAANGFAGRAPTWRLWRLATSHRIPPHDLAYQCLGRAARGAPGDYLTDGRVQLLLRTINLGRDTTTLDDKIRFAGFCAQHRLAAPPALACIAAGSPLPDASADYERDLFAKLRHGSGARGAQRWLFAGSTLGWRSHDGRTARDWPALAAHLAASAATHGDEYFVQPRLHDHPALADLGNGSLSTVRLLTLRTPAGAIEPFAAIFNLPTGTALTNNIRDGALACPIDLERGTLLTAFSGAPGKPQFARHPRTGAPIAGRELPDWPALLSLALRAHRAEPLATLPLIGWDIALTGDGPTLLEGNHQVSLNFHQVAPNPPLAATRLPAILLWHLRAATEGRP